MGLPYFQRKKGEQFTTVTYLSVLSTLNKSTNKQSVCFCYLAPSATNPTAFRFDFEMKYCCIGLGFEKYISVHLLSWRKWG